MSQNTTDELERKAAAEEYRRSLKSIPVDQWDGVAAYWNKELKTLLNSLESPSTSDRETAFLRGQISMIRIFIDLPSHVKTDLESLGDGQ